MKANWIVLSLSLFIFTKIKAQNTKIEKDTCSYFYVIQFEGVEHKSFTKDLQNILYDTFRANFTFQEESKNFIIFSEKNVDRNDLLKLVPNKLIYFKKLYINKEYNNQIDSAKEKNTESEN